ncbi:MAG: hypothetical protein Q9187_006387 [Circinaria calcarea]
MTTILRWVRNCTRKAPSPPISFLNTNYEFVSATQKLEEEAFEDFTTGKYYPVRIGDVFASKYQVVGKLGFGVSSTVWLARNLEAHRHVALKVFTRDHQNDGEIDMYEHLSKGNPNHIGKRFVRTALDSFKKPRAGGEHHCLVHIPLWGSLRDMMVRNPYRQKFTEQLLRATLYCLLQALDYLHTDRKVIHTDISANNILLEIDDRSMLNSFVDQELKHPSPRKQVEDSIVYASRLFGWPPTGEPILSDFGSAEKGDADNTRKAGPSLYRSPEVLLEMKWSYSIDIWNVGVMRWDLFEGRTLFSGRDPDRKEYSTRAHLAEMIALIGPPPVELVKRGRRSAEFFDDDGNWRNTVPIPDRTSLEQLEGSLEGKRKELFLNFMTSMLQWAPEHRKTAKELLEDPWLNNRI